MKAILRGDGWWTYSSNDNHFSLKLILVSSESMLAWKTRGCSSWGILWPLFMLSQHLFCTDNVMSNVDGIVLVRCLWVYWPTACLILFIEKCLYQNMGPVIWYKSSRVPLLVWDVCFSGFCDSLALAPLNVSWISLCLFGCMHTRES